ncbi:hypothetical protein M404DRAFT_21414 [Pisolithus tinctorius Marx 270]|uniref:Uncharacterized protein n=1 Tax=Pisolithus tinctorius Marx 270 TaxID=870435 RepID=A0A0C3PNP5_PISTI|nr:hypothetical protein M404DRAFT_21414 [Pisolithus tinctorius Marx 270]
MFGLKIPCQGSPKALSFPGCPKDLQSYFDDIIDFCDGFRLSDGLAHIKFTLKYAPFESVDPWSHLAESSNGDWNCFTSEVVQLYPELEESCRNQFLRLRSTLAGSDTVSTSSLAHKNPPKEQVPPSRYRLGTPPLAFIIFCWEEQAQLEAERVVREQSEAERAEREKAKAEKAVQEAEERRVHEEERQEAEHKCKAKAGKSDEASASGEAGGEVKRVVMDPSCTHCTQAQVVCEFLMDGNKKWVACVCCNQSKGKCWWRRDGKDTKASPKATSKVDKGKKWKADDETPEPRPSQKKRVKSKLTKVLEIDKPNVSGSGVRKARAV